MEKSPLTIGVLAFLGGLLVNGAWAGYLYGNLDARVSSLDSRTVVVETFQKESNATNITIFSELATIKTLLQEVKESFDRERTRSRILENRGGQ